VVGGNSALTTLSMPALTSLERLLLNDNRVLSGFDLPELTVGSYMVISHNPALTRIGWPKLAKIQDVTFDDNDAMVEAPALGFTVPPTTNASLRFSNNDSLRRLPTLTQSMASLYIINNDALPNLEGLRFTGDGTLLTIEDNDALTSLAGMQVPWLSRLAVIGNPNMTSLSGAPETIRSELEIRDNPALTSVAGVDAPYNRFDLLNNDALTSLDGMVVSPGSALGSLRIEDNAALRSIRGLDAIATSNGGVSIQRNPVLPQCAAQAFSTRVTGGGTRTINGNDTSATCP
jgi:hypothetical protein